MRKTVLVTGASAGIGAATARLAAENGYDIALNYLSDHDGAKATAQAAQEAGAQVVLCQGDVASPEGIARIFAQIDAHFPKLDALVNNAGIVDVAVPVTEFTHDRLRQMFDINVIGSMLVAKEAVRRMLAHGQGGAVVNISSVAARLGSANQYVDYAASKAAIDAFTKGLADEVAPQNIRVNAVRPGLIETEIHAKGGQPGRAERLAPNVPMQRTGTPLEIAEAALYLLSDQASYVTGTTLDVSGGR